MKNRKYERWFKRIGDRNRKKDEVQKKTKTGWNELINEAAENIALKTLLEENQPKTKTKQLMHEKFEMRRYIFENKNM